MPSKRKYNVKGTNDFIVLAGIFFFLCLWSIKDAWFPSDKVLKKHPREIVASFETGGTVGQLHVKQGDTVGEGQLLAELRQAKLEEEVTAAKNAYTEAKDCHALAEAAARNAAASPELSQKLAEAQAAMDAALDKVKDTRDRMDSSILKAPGKGDVKQVAVAVHSQVEAGDTVLIIDPKDHFYLFNKSLAIFSFLAFWVFLAVHLLAR